MKKIFLFLINLFFVNVILQGQICISTNSFTVSANSADPSCAGKNDGSASVTIVGGLAPFQYDWTPNVGTTSSVSNLSPGSYTVSTTSTGCTSLGPELVKNGDFESGNTGFTTAYSFNNNIQGEGTYCVGTNVAAHHSGLLAPTKDHTTGTGNFMIINGSPTAGINVWQETVVVTPNTDYYFSFWVFNLGGAAPADCQFTINGVLLGTRFSAKYVPYPPNNNNGNYWEQFCLQWNSGPSSSAVLKLEDFQTAASGNDFAIDDVSFRTCVNTPISTIITITDPPPIIASASTSPTCLTNSNQFADNSIGNPTKWTWTFDDGNTSISQNPSHTFGTPGIHTATLVVENLTGCLATTMVQTYINPLPLPNFLAPVVCQGVQTCFTDQSTIASGSIVGWSWNFGGGTPSNQPSPCFTFTATGSYPVLLTVTSDSGCQNSITIQAVVSPPPVPNFTATSVCLNATSIFTDASIPSSVNDPINKWDWNFGDGQPNSTQPNPTHVYSAVGTHTVTLVVTSKAGCTDSINKTVTVYKLPIAAFTNPSSGCVPVCQTFMDASQPMDGNITAWAWTLTGGTPATATTATVNACWNVAGSYGVELMVTTDYGCTSTLAIPNYINVYDKPRADFNPLSDKASINDPAFTFNNMWSTDVVKWTWNFGDGSPLDSVNMVATHSYTSTVIGNATYKYDVCLLVENKGGCLDSICKTVELIPEFMFYIPNTITPNGDSINDLFFGKCRGVKEYNIWIFDRWGNLVWECSYKGDNALLDGSKFDGVSSVCKWNGKVQPGGQDMNGSSALLVQQDVYVWKVKLTDIFDKKHSYVGNVNVTR